MSLARLLRSPTAVLWMLVLVVAAVLLGRSRFQQAATVEKSPSSVELLVAIPATMGDEEKIYRSVVRKTWGAYLSAVSPPRPSITNPVNSTGKQRGKILFFIGVKGLDKADLADLKQEQRRSGDMVFLDFEESYKGLSSKMILIYDWIATSVVNQYPNVKYVMKTDTDVWINVPALLDLVDKYPPVRTFIGHKYVNNRRLKQGKWANPEYSSMVYPQYMAGAGYLLSVDIALWIQHQMGLGWLKPLPNEDALMGIWFAGLNVNWIHSPHFKPLIAGEHYKRTTHLADWVCEDKDILLHHMTSEGIEILHKWWQTCGSPCEATCLQIK